MIDSVYLYQYTEECNKARSFALTSFLKILKSRSYAQILKRKEAETDYLEMPFLKRQSLLCLLSSVKRVKLRSQTSFQDIIILTGCLSGRSLRSLQAGHGASLNNKKEFFSKQFFSNNMVCGTEFEKSFSSDTRQEIKEGMNEKKSN